MQAGRRHGWTVAAATALAALAGCERAPPPKPPVRADDGIEVPPQRSVIAVPVEAGLGDITRVLEREVPRELWRIDKPGQTCLAPRRVNLLVAKVKTPRIKCRIVGRVTRGRLTLGGAGRQLVVTMPVHAVVQARDVAGIVKHETATGDARVRAIVTLSLTQDWQPRARVAIAYDWTTEPGIDFLGQRIEFTGKADERLHKVVAKLERTLPRELEKLNLRHDVTGVWGKAFTSLSLNRANPPVWMRITPQDLRFGGYRVTGRRLRLDLGMTALTETFVGAQPPDPPVTPLPPMRPLAAPPGKITFFIPVIADYRELEPVVLRALTKRSARPFDVPGVGAIDARFEKVSVYDTQGGRIAVGVTFHAKDREERFGASSGTVWLTGVPSNAADSRRVSFGGLAVSGATDSAGTDLLLKLANAPALSGTIAEALAQNFERDYASLIDKITRAIAEKREGDFLIRAQVRDLHTGTLRAAGQGLYLPVQGTGTAAVSLLPR